MSSPEKLADPAEASGAEDEDVEESLRHAVGLYGFLCAGAVQIAVLFSILLGRRRRRH